MTLTPRLLMDAASAGDCKKYTKVVTNPETGRKNKVRYGAKGYTIAPGTNKGDRYCARSFGDMKSEGYNCSGAERNTPLCLSRAKWKCSGKTSRRDSALTPLTVSGLARIDASEVGKGKPCGESHIPRTHKCSKTQGVLTPANLKTVAKVALGAGLLSAAVYLASNWSKKVEQQFREAKATNKPYRVSKSVPDALDGLNTIGRGADGVIYVSRDSKYVFKQAHNPKEIANAVTMQIKAQKAGVSTATMHSYDKDRGIVKMEALLDHAPINKQSLDLKSRKRAGVELIDNLTKLHSADITHEDFNARNILVDKTGNIRIIDFSRSKGAKNKTQAKRSELNGAIDLAEYLGYISPSTHKKAKEELIKVRLKSTSYEEAVKRIKEMINADSPPKKYKLPTTPVDAVIKLE